MRVVPIGITEALPQIRYIGYKPHNDPPAREELLEAAGRACYQSFDRPNPATATNETYLAHILEVAHFSILEHVSVTFYIEDVPRSFTHELVRHRHMSFSQLSQRYVDESESESVPPPAFDGAQQARLWNAHKEAALRYQLTVDELLGRGLSRKEARQAARAFLPEATGTVIVVTGNVRAWRELIGKRTAVDDNGKPLADLAFHNVASEILLYLKNLVPNSMQDM